MAHTYSVIRSKTRRNKLRNTRRHHGGRGGVLETGATQSAMVSNPAPFSGGKRNSARSYYGGRGGLGVGSYGSRSTLPSSDPLSTIGGKRGVPIHSSLHRKKTRKQKVY